MLNIPPMVTTDNDQILVPIFVQPVNQDIATDKINPITSNADQEPTLVQVNKAYPPTKVILEEILDQQQPSLAEEPLRRSIRERRNTIPDDFVINLNGHEYT